MKKIAQSRALLLSDAHTTASMHRAASRRGGHLGIQLWRRDRGHCRTTTLRHRPLSLSPTIGPLPRTPSPRHSRTTQRCHLYFCREEVLRNHHSPPPAPLPPTTDPLPRTSSPHHRSQPEPQCHHRVSGAVGKRMGEGQSALLLLLLLRDEQCDAQCWVGMLTHFLGTYDIAD